ncbi:hypothetical protein L596_024864 [Steinernema carpocapsae]|uniref:Uncharacterized protein n=1 Tax=Steinernema carpocapsae TaxID=34508 RepID=A0A4V5ZYM6_STECR|nr:hypothetical protein L596_024864 [Steinernema carpocapsae]
MRTNKIRDDLLQQDLLRQHELLRQKVVTEHVCLCRQNLYSSCSCIFGSFFQWDPNWHDKTVLLKRLKIKLIVKCMSYMYNTSKKGRRSSEWIFGVRAFYLGSPYKRGLGDARVPLAG